MFHKIYNVQYKKQKIANWAKVERMYRLEIKDEVLVE